MAILVVDDDRHIVDLVAIHLEGAGYDVLRAYDGEEALQIVEETIPDLAIVDVMMPKLDGYQLTEELRAYDSIPILMLTAKGELEDKEHGFAAGTDDYVVKPFEPKELLFRVRAILRRYDKATDEAIVAGPLVIDRKSYEVKLEETTFLLPLKEFELLSLLASRPGHVYERELLLERVWGYDYEGDEQTLNVHIKRLRDKLEPFRSSVWIRTVRGVGYTFEVYE